MIRAFDYSFLLGFEHLIQNVGTPIPMKMKTLMHLGTFSVLAHCHLANACMEDFNNDEIVGVAEVLAILHAWGDCPSLCPEDVDASGFVDMHDLAPLLDAWGPCPSQQGTTIIDINFEQHAVGPYTEDMLAADWNAPLWSQGVNNGRVHIVHTDDGSQALAVDYPALAYGTAATGAQWKLAFDESFHCVRVSYRLQFADAFDFVKGGKLPGLIGGEGNTGGGAPDGTDGWSARMMWRTHGTAVQYVYHPDQPHYYGEDLPWTLEDAPVHFQSGQWHEVVHEIAMNSPGQHNGRITCWFDGQMAMHRSDMRFRDISTFAIDGFYFSTFFGGGDASWATSKDERILFDDIMIRTCD